jgi:hypothetical protein
MKQQMVAEYLCRQYPGVLFLSDARAFLKLTIPQAVRSKQVQKPDFACPDLIIFEARQSYHGMFIELKAETPFKKDESLKAGDHLRTQYDALLALSAKGYHVSFQWEFEKIKSLIDWYLK